MIPQLRVLQASLANTEKLNQSFRIAENLLPALRQQAPHLVPRLAVCFYWAVVGSGVPADVSRYQRIFGAPADDPKLARLTIPLHLFVKPNLYANPDVIDFGSVSTDPMRKDPAIRELLTQTFLVKKRAGEFAITKITSNMEALELRKDPPHGDSSTYRIDVSLNPQKIKAGKLEGSIEIDTDDKDFPKIRIPVTGRVF